MYHNSDARELGYWSGEALQAVFGAEVIKGGANLVKGGVKAAQASKKVAQGTKTTKSVAKAVESIEKGAARATKVEHVAQQAERVEYTTKVAKAEERVERAAKVEQTIQGASEQVQEAYFSAKAWLGDDCRVIINKQNGNTVLMSEDGLRKLRFDIKYSHGYPPHVHLQEFRNGEWSDAIPGIHHIYPKGD